ncbi:Eapp [Symbiodinium necroappetens]|uniref:Eapp protein n=2 Tax=Symbiodinium TaxID=2949 RepID=A0A812S525_9DINO|nr:E2F-associated phosphoprotein [Symbiodinium microadriaticum]CAE7465099.1 Eapp [Symbiodinium necroappetens]CAE7941050.1 Eapp [Symbiodinium sp. KB8]|mmetsp:Transcript_49727/g.118430  ORF Transcript_49727/g.118430 Transcript_49727/m.118430 type:complete len:164 (-) Transcript_49727:103-594(-)
MANAMEVDDGDADDDDWDPRVAPGIVLRPHIVQWNVAQGTEKVDNLDVDPLHDPEADDQDEKWVADQLLQPDTRNVKGTDAVLNCPGCFTPVCYQCQRHEQFTRQWRASEVRNCKVDKSVALSMAKDDPAKYFALRCETCNADVGLQDMEGIFHLFHVLESLA